MGGRRGRRRTRPCRATVRALASRSAPLRFGALDTDVEPASGFRRHGVSSELSAPTPAALSKTAQERERRGRQCELLQRRDGAARSARRPRPAVGGYERYGRGHPQTCFGVSAVLGAHDGHQLFCSPAEHRWIAPCASSHVSSTDPRSQRRSRPPRSGVGEAACHRTLRWPDTVHDAGGRGRRLDPRRPRRGAIASSSRDRIPKHRGWR